MMSGVRVYLSICDYCVCIVLFFSVWLAYCPINASSSVTLDIDLVYYDTALTKDSVLFCWCCRDISLVLVGCMQLQMLGYDVSWAAFNVIEVMSSPKFTHKVWLTVTQSSCISSTMVLVVVWCCYYSCDFTVVKSQLQYSIHCICCIWKKCCLLQKCR